ncbi:hypothetical protein Arub01_35340 [Actinomadura rubrobrunea]|uniref:Uncharacterized protein n=1 Tax=Actinomadura rubrobrunea TaxID=115335 RepID=A0A9W6PVP6_9ACTN|nr:sialidase family protein [Actinomadura rubrobrunea]GLW65290.1 hypothetical protein Arub01_35340 [Actinomadura rubrobrunea]
MTPRRTPDEEPGHDQPQASSDPQNTAPPPPPQWLNEPQSSTDAPLLPDVPFAVGPGEGDATRDDGADPMRTEVFTAKDAAPASPPSSPAPEETVTDLSAWLPAESGTATPEASTASPTVADDAADSTADSAGQADDIERTRADSDQGAGTGQATQQVPRPQQSASEPQQQMPGESAVAPFPYAQHIPGTPLPAPTPTPTQQPPAHQPPAQEPPASSGPEPFPYAQEIPDAKPVLPASTPTAPPSQPPAPFPFPQEIPGDKPQPTPFPYAQEIPGQNPPGPPSTQVDEPASRPVAPPPQIDEPWRTAPSGKKKRGSGKLGKRIALIGGAGLAAAALVAGGVVVVSNLGGGDDEGAGGDAQLARSVFPVDGSVRTDGRDQELTAVEAVGDTVVAVGAEWDAQSSRGQFLVSTDGGRSFRSAEVRGEDDGEPGPKEVPRVVGGSSRGWVAIGRRAGGAGVVWTSKDGRSWRRQPDAVGNPFGPGNRVRRVIGSDHGFLAIGDHSAKGDFSDAVPAVWVSADGTRWEARFGDQVSLPVNGGRVTVLENAVASGGTMLLEGLHVPSGRNARPGRRVWRSTDGGRSWTETKVPVPKGNRGLVIGGGPVGFAALRDAKEGRKTFGHMYLSKDGASWTEAGRLEASGYRRVIRLLASGNAYTAMVARGRDILLSRSADGRTWQDAGSLPSENGRIVHSGTVSGEQTIAVGRTTGSGDADALLAVWDGRGSQLPVDVAKIPGAVRPDHSVTSVGVTADRAVAVGSSGGDAAIWTSLDGSTWSRAQGEGTALSRPGPQKLLSVVHGNAGWLAVGSDQAAPRRPLVVTSSDGATWEAVDSGEQFKPAKNTSLATFAATYGPAGYVIVGEDGLSAATWFSTDLKTWERGRSVGNNGLEALPNSNRWLRDVASGPSGYVAVGGLRDPALGKGPAARPAVWTSPDGKQWTLQQLPLLGGLAEAFLTHVAMKGNTVVALGTGAAGSTSTPVGYVSTDGGKTWRESRPAAPEETDNIKVTALTATSNGFVATGTAGRDGSTDVVSWTSADGSSWSGAKHDGKGLGGPGDQEITGLTPFKDHLLGVGRNMDQSDEQPVLWRRPIP